jgi:hypothetical protein
MTIFAQIEINLFFLIEWVGCHIIIDDELVLVNW